MDDEPDPVVAALEEYGDVLNELVPDSLCFAFIVYTTDPRASGVVGRFDSKAELLTALCQAIARVADDEPADRSQLRGVDPRVDPRFDAVSRRSRRRLKVVTMPHVHEFIMNQTPERIDFGSGVEHTIVYVLSCDCGAAIVWPQQNYQLVPPVVRDIFERRLKEHGLTLIDEGQP